MKLPARMRIPNWRAFRWKNPFTSLPARISFLVFLATLFTSLAITAISVNSIDTFLRGKIDQKFPQLLASSVERLELWYDQRELEIGVFANSRILRDNIGRLQPGASSPRARRARDEVAQYLAYVLESFPQYGALFILDAKGETLLWVGEETPLPQDMLKAAVDSKRLALSDMVSLGGVRIQLASAPLEQTSGRDTGSLHALLHLDSLDELHHGKDLGPLGETFLVGADGRYLSKTARRSPGQSFARPLPAEGEVPVVTDYENEAGDRVVGSAVHYPRFGWTVVVEEPYAEAFAPVVSSIRRILGINLAIVAVFGFAAFRIAVSIVKPVEALSVAVRRTSEGEKNVVIPESRTSDEVGVLTRAFNEMTRRLASNARELEAQNEELQRVNEILEQLSITDGLTKLHNHRFFQDHLAKEVKRVERSGEPLSLILADIDHFKRWNDRLGHAMGDEILRKVAEVMNGLIRETDLLARYGGEEFALLAASTDLNDAVQLAEKIREAISETQFFLGPPSEAEPVTISFGVSVYRGDQKAFFNDADRALYAAKSAGRDCVMTSAETGRG
ncbi:MAG: diguanylate cyclase [Proteobacteria bacterium]|nr:diguanylate cyclase [Pseudomonadota bacterium]